MSYLVDTSVLVRRTDTADPSHRTALNALLRLRRRQEQLYIAPQNNIEFRNVATRPTGANGLGMSATDADFQIAQFEILFLLLPENAAIYFAWKSVVAASGVLGKQVHDARLAAVCHVYGLSHVLTFNVQHFLPYVSIGPGLTVVHPKDV